jgi:transposase
VDLKERAAAALGQAHGRAADQRNDGLHKLTTRLAAEFGTVVAENLNVAGMMRKPGDDPGRTRHTVCVKRCPKPARIRVADPR